MAENKLEPPKRCDCCNSFDVVLIAATKNKWPWVYLCNDCKASVGCHPDTYTPLGRMAGLNTRLMRRDAHRYFDELWKSGLMSRDLAYRWLAEQLQIPFENCHISWLTDKQLKTTIRISEEYFLQCRHIAARRKAKRIAKAKKDRSYEKSRIIRRKSS